MKFNQRHLIAAIISLTIIAIFAGDARASSPVNDNFANAIELSPISAHMTATNAEASKEAGEPNHSSNTGGKSIWFKFTPVSIRPIQITLTRSNFDTTLAVYIGTAVNQLTVREQNADISAGNNRSCILIRPIVGTTYYVAVDGNSVGGNPAAEGTIVLDLNTAASRNSNDFDRDGVTDIGVFRPSDGTWYLLNSSNNTLRTAQWGQSGDVPVVGDYNAGIQTVSDFAVFRPSDGTWYTLLNNQVPTAPGVMSFGAAGDIPLAGDFIGDNNPDYCVFRPSNGTWYYHTATGTPMFAFTQFGLAGDIPVTGDFDADYRTDIGVFRPSTGTWYLKRSTNGLLGVQFGMTGDVPVRGDYDGDGLTDLAVFRPSTGTWYVLRSNNGSVQGYHWGTNGDLPAVGDYNGDGKFDFAVFRPSNGFWYISFNGSNDAPKFVQFGQNGDVPVTGLRY